MNGGTCVVSTCSCVLDAQSFGWTGAVCELPQCAASCNGASSGTCALATGATTPSCMCIAPWSGATCSKLQCAPACLNGGTCQLASQTAICNCAGQFTGGDCSVAVAAGTCPPCGMHGSCGGTGTNFTCACTSGWAGSACNIPVCAGYIAGVKPSCNGNGVCSSTSGTTPSCQCAAGWGGADCGTEVCSPTYCANGGVCSVSTVTGTDPTCACPSQWTGTTCLVSRNTGGSLPVWVIPVAVVGGVLVLGGLLAITIVAARKAHVRNYETKFREAQAANEMAQMAGTM